MAGWVCQTKKLLVSAISSLAGELEQTVQDFNDAVHNFSTSRTDRVTQSQKEADDQAKMDVEEEDQDFGQIPMAGHLQMDLDCPAPAFAGRRHQVATTRQPERTRVSATLNSRLSQSSPSLTSARPGEAKVTVHSHILSSSTYVYSLPRKSPRLSALSQSSPCLIHSTGAIKKSKMSCVNTQSHSHRSLDELHHDAQFESVSARSDHMLQIRRGITHVQTCHRVPVQQKIHHKLGHKRPGKVIRAATTTSHNVGDINDYPDYPDFDEEMPEVSQSQGELEEGSGRESDLHDPQNDRQLMIRTSSPILVEREQRFRIWSGLAPLTRMLSFAFAQVANMVLMLTEDVQNNMEQNAASREILSITYPSTHDVQRRALASAMETQGRFSPIKETEDIPEEERERGDYEYEPKLSRSTLVRSPYSTDSFEIIEASCYDDMCDSVTDTFGFQQIPRSGQMETFAYSESQLVGENLSVSRGFLNSITDMSSSAEFVNFDFRDLISNRHSNKLNPVTVEKMPTSSTQGLAEGDICQSFYVICDTVPDMFVDGLTDDTNTSWASVDNHDLEIVDEDDNESVSFTIISSENDEEDFQIY